MQSNQDDFKPVMQSLFMAPAVKLGSSQMRAQQTNVSEKIPIQTAVRSNSRQTPIRIQMSSSMNQSTADIKINSKESQASYFPV